MTLMEEPGVETSDISLASDHARELLDYVTSSV